ncbi:MAG: putative ABC transporter permease [Treponema sp.]|nr:putative ABC transporter permease [Treponema sp.]
MDIFLVITFLFCVGNIFGWVLELFYRRFISKSNIERKWINPGFLNGPYLPLYGFSLVILFTLSYIDVSFIENPYLQKIVLFALMALCITLFEFIAGLIFIKGMKIKLWDYSTCFGNIKGIICPQYTFYWWLLSGLYYFLVHPKIQEWLFWFTNHLSYSFFIGFFYGIYAVDICYSFNISAKMRNFAKENQLEIKYENLKEAIRKRNVELRKKRNFLFPFMSKDITLKDLLKEIFDKK